MPKTILTKTADLTQLVASLIANEDPKHPLTDSQLLTLVKNATQKEISYQCVVWHRRKIGPQSSIRGNFSTLNDVADKIAALIAAEDRNDPLSDKQLASQLKENVKRIVRARKQPCRRTRLQNYRSIQDEKQEQSQSV